MSEVRSGDGTPIAYEKSGQGPALILVDGALCSRAMGPAPKLAAALTEQFTVYTYDRRGRNRSGDTEPYAVEREVEDLEAVVGAAGGSALVYGISSGAALVLETARQCPGITKLALYEPPFIVDSGREPVPGDFPEQLHQQVAAGRRGEAVKMFLRSVGMPAIFMRIMQLTPPWRKLKAVAHTLPYDMTILRPYQGGKALPAERWAGVTVPALVLAGGKSDDWMKNASRALADILPNALHQVLPGQTHMVKPKALAPALVEFFRGSSTGEAAGRPAGSARSAVLER